MFNKGVIYTGGRRHGGGGGLPLPGNIGGTISGHEGA